MQSLTQQALARAGRALVIILVSSSVGCAQSKNEFDSARQLVIEGRYAEAEAALQRLAKNSPQGKFASRVGLFLFKTSVAQNKMNDARQWCQWTIDKHPRSLEAHKCHYKLGMVELMEGKTGAARERFEILAKNPDGPLAAEATAMVRFLKAHRIEPEAALAPAGQ